MQETYSAGENIASYCTKCRLNLDHTVVALVGQTIAKVKCMTCGSTHKFRNPADAPKPRAPRAKKGSTLPSAASLWEAGMAGARGKEHAYSMVAKYRIGDIVVHDRFGKGVVQKLYENKCDVLFEDRQRLMASAN
jgi:hypothetical protein